MTALGVARSQVGASTPRPEFEVATIKPSKSVGVSLQVSPGGLFTTTGTSMNDLIKLAYDLHPCQIISGSSWLETEKYDVTGKPDEPGKPELEHLKVMVWSLLADRSEWPSGLYHRTPGITLQKHNHGGVRAHIAECR